MFAINDVLKFVNVGKTMSGEQMKSTCKEILEEFHYLNAADLAICFGKGKRGNYGQLYDRFDGMIVMDWLSKYVEDRLTVAENISQQKHYDTKENRAFIAKNQKTKQK